MRLLVAISGVLLLCGARLPAAEPPVLAPASAWNLRYDEQACRLVRMFGTGDDSITFTMARYGFGSGFELLLAGKGLDPRGSSLRFRFLPASDYNVLDDPLYGTGPEGVTAWQFGGSLVPAERSKAIERLSEKARADEWRAAEAAARDLVTGFEMRSGMKRSFILDTGKLDKALAALDTCIDDLVSTWGYDPARIRSLARAPQPRSNPGRWFDPSDYPSESYYAGKSGIVRFRLDVDEDGTPVRCVIQGSYTDPAFEETVCRVLMQKARFEPAIDAQGERVAAYWQNSVMWLASR